MCLHCSKFFLFTFFDSILFVYIVKICFFFTFCLFTLFLFLVCSKFVILILFVLFTFYNLFVSLIRIKSVKNCYRSNVERQNKDDEQREVPSNKHRDRDNDVLTKNVSIAIEQRDRQHERENHFGQQRSQRHFVPAFNCPPY